MSCGETIKYYDRALNKHSDECKPLPRKKDVLKKVEKAHTAASEALRRSLQPTEFVDVVKSFYNKDSPDDSDKWDAFWALSEPAEDSDEE